MDERFEREMPHSIEAERSVLGAVIVKQSLDGTEQLQEDSFYLRPHSEIFQAMRMLADAGNPIDIVSLSAKLDEQKVLQDIGGILYLQKLGSSVPTEANLEYYVDIVHNRHLHRQTILAAQETLRKAWEADNPHEVIADMQVKTNNLTDQASQAQEMRPIKEVALKAFENIEHRFAHFGDEVTGIPSGYPDLDKMTSGWQNGDLIIVAARPSVGKTTFALNVAQYAGVKSKKHIAVFSLEMSAEQLVQRMMSAEQNIEATKLRTGYLEGDDWERLTMAISTLSGSQIYIDDTPVLTVQEIAAKCRRMKKRIGLDLILIDYLQLIAGSRKRSENRQQEVSEISRTLKGLARELGVPVIALSQLSRAVEQRQDKRPMMSDLRESGAIEQDADIVAFLYRDDYYNQDTEKKNLIEIIIAKQRNGPVATVELAFLKNLNKFVSIDRSHTESASDGRQIPDMYRGA